MAKGFKSGYVDGNTKFTFNQNNCDDNGFKEGYVDGGEREAKPFNPNQNPIEEIVIVPPTPQGGGKLYVQELGPISNTSADGDFVSADTFSFLPVEDSDMFMTVNGQSIFPANGAAEQSTSLFYVTDSTGTIVRAKGTYQIGDRFRWNGSLAYQLESTDDVKIIYEI